MLVTAYTIRGSFPGESPLSTRLAGELLSSQLVFPHMERTGCKNLVLKNKAGWKWGFPSLAAAGRMSLWLNQTSCSSTTARLTHPPSWCPPATTRWTEMDGTGVQFFYLLTADVEILSNSFSRGGILNRVLVMLCPFLASGTGGAGLWCVTETTGRRHHAWLGERCCHRVNVTYRD